MVEQNKIPVTEACFSSLSYISGPTSWDQGNWELRIRSCQLQKIFQSGLDVAVVRCLKAMRAAFGHVKAICAIHLQTLNSQNQYFILIESRGCEIAFYSRTWGSKH